MAHRSLLAVIYHVLLLSGGRYFTVLHVKPWLPTGSIRAARPLRPRKIWARLPDALMSVKSLFLQERRSLTWAPCHARRRALFVLETWSSEWKNAAERRRGHSVAFIMMCTLLFVTPPAFLYFFFLSPILSHFSSSTTGVLLLTKTITIKLKRSCSCKWSWNKI